MNCHDELVALANIQSSRVLALYAEERRSGSILPKLNCLIKSYQDLLLVIQEVRFDLGLDEYNGMTKEAITAAAMRERQTQEEVRKAVETAEQILRKHGMSSQTNEDMMHEDNLSNK